MLAGCERKIEEGEGGRRKGCDGLMDRDQAQERK